MMNVCHNVFMNSGHVGLMHALLTIGLMIVRCLPFILRSNGMLYEIGPSRPAAYGIFCIGNVIVNQMSLILKLREILPVNNFEE